ncbi:MAG: hypothetical protein ACK2U5_07665 [Candidatus Promineifilaceae bacterium]
MWEGGIRPPIPIIGCPSPSALDIINFIAYFCCCFSLPWPIPVRFTLLEIGAEKSAVPRPNDLLMVGISAQLNGAVLAQQFVDVVAIVLPVINEPGLVDERNQQRQ